jgi:hypothetical protein
VQEDPNCLLPFDVEVEHGAAHGDRCDGRADRVDGLGRDAGDEAEAARRTIEPPVLLRS